MDLKSTFEVVLDLCVLCGLKVTSYKDDGLCISGITAFVLAAETQNYFV